MTDYVYEYRDTKQLAKKKAQVLLFIFIFITTDLY